MNKQEAITILAGLYRVPIENGAVEFASEINKAIDMAIEALEKPTEVVTDCISRKRAIEIVKRAETKEIAYLALINLEPKEIPTCDECRLPECLADKQDDWVPVSEPPKENGKYLVSVDGYWKFVDIFRYNVVKETWYALDKRDNYETDWNKCIVAWQPMPKIYRSLDNYNDDDCNSCEASQGDWLVGGICSKCGYDITPDLDWGEEAPEYCPKCNAKLR